MQLPAQNKRLSEIVPLAPLGKPTHSQVETAPAKAAYVSAGDGLLEPLNQHFGLDL
jgi:hypothetical protein